MQGKTEFGQNKDGRMTYLYTITNKNGMTAKCTDFGAILVELHVPDKQGKSADVVLGYDNVEAYADNWPGYGSIIGRNANRIANAEFSLNGTTYKLDKNDGEHNLHSGFNGYHKRIWDAEMLTIDNGQAIKFSCISPDGDQGYPGEVKVSVTYVLTDENEIKIIYDAVSDADTVINMTNHSYFNLSGHNSGYALKQKIWIDADEFTAADSEQIAHGEVRKVKDTPFDFNVLKPACQDIDKDYDQLIFGKGYDRNFVLKTTKGNVSLVAKLVDDVSGRIMEVYTDSPGMQLYTGNYLTGSGTGKDGIVYQDYEGIAFETQFPPNAVNISSFPQPFIKAGEVYHYETIYKFLNK
ncbi:MAG: aldose epimerase family protein [Eubacterium sp.]